MTGAGTKLAGRVAIITGGGAGCGPVMARRFIAEGARVVIAARRLGPLEETAQRLGKDCLPVQADVGKEDDVRNMVDRAIQAFGQVDIMVTNAPHGGENRLLKDQTLENWNAGIATNLTGPMLCSREVLNRSMLERRTGVILNVSSVAAWQAIPGMTDYVSTKAAIRAFTQVVAREVGEYGIRCNCMVPGSVDTEAWHGYHMMLAEREGVPFEVHRAKALAAFPLRTISTPEDVANFAMFLCSDDSRTITGQSMNIDAGAYMVG